MKSKTIRFFSFFVMLAVLISTMQVTLAVIAVDLQTDEIIFDSPSGNNETAEAVDTTPYETVAYVVGEDESLRKENEKHFRMSDGSYIAAVYPESVHYLEDGEWKEIDNTLSLTADGYVNAENDFEVTFSSDRNSDELYTLTDGEHSVKLILKTNTDNDSAVYSLRPSNGRIISVEAEEDHADVGFDVKSPAESVDAFKKANPNATDEEIKEIVSAQNEENKKQREFMLQPKKLNSSLNYADVIGNVDIEYIVTPSSIKENIILETANEGNVFEFILETDLEAVLNSDGTIDLIDGENVIFSMPAPYMYDANGETSTDVEYLLDTENGKIVLTVAADEEWIADGERVFPITIDPTVSTGKTNSADWNIVTRYISDADMSNSNQGSDYWYMGCDEYNGNYYAYMKVNYLPDIPFNCKYTGASISMYMYTDGFIENGASTFNVMVQEALSSWTTQFSATPTTNSNPIIDYYNLISSHQGKRISFDITNAAKNWYNGSTNNGLVFTSKLTNGNAMSKSNGAAAIFKGYVNSSTETEYMPFFCVSYRNYIGVEGYLSYHEADAGRAGHAYISDYTGNLTISRSLVSGTGFELKYIYNSPYGDKTFTSNDVYNTVNYSNMKSANGWRLNVQQSVVEKNLTQYDGTELVSEPYIVYSDEDGTEHYFAKTGTNEYKDEDGLGLTITKSTDGKTYTMKDEKDRQWIFIYGYLSQMIDSNGNKVVLLYDTTSYSASSTTWHPKSSAGSSQNQLKKIVYVPDGGSAITVATLTYDSSTKYLTSIKDRTNSTDRTIKFTLSADGYLTKIEDPDYEEDSDTTEESKKKYTRYIYNAFPSRLYVAYDSEADYGLVFEYHTNNPNAIMSYCDFTGSNEYNDSTWTIQNKLYASYDTQLSRFRHTGGDKTIATDDDVLSLYVFDTNGRTITVRSEDNDKNTLGVAGGTYTSNSGTAKTNNKILKEGGTGAIGQNLLNNSGFEANSNWILTRSSTTNFSGAFVSGQRHTGSQAYQMIANASGGWLAIYQNVTLPKTGYYTFSAYVKVTSIGTSTTNGNGVRISIKDSSDNVLATSRFITAVTSTDIDNGWVRLSCTYEATSTDTVKVIVGLTGVTGTVYVDDVQFERNEVASPYNLVQNGSFIRGNSYWENPNNGTYASVTQYDGTTGYAMKITGGPEKGDASAAQTINVNLPGTETYVLSGWAKADSVPLSNPNRRSFQITAMFTYSDGTEDYAQNPFSYLAWGQWQYICVPVVPKADKTVTSVTVTCSYKGNANVAYFDDISLIRESAQAYTYDEDGNVIAVNKTNTDEISSVYENGDLLSSTGGANGNYTYTYDDYHNVKTAKNGNVTMSMTYDTYGNATSTKLTGDSSSLFMSTQATYTDGGTKTYSTTDNLGNTTRNSYNSSRNLLTGITAPVSNSYTYNGTTSTTNYTYTDYNRLNTAYITSYISLNYVYDKGNVSTLKRGGYLSPGVGTKIEQIYSYTYNDYGQETKVKVGDRTLVNKGYSSSTHNLSMYAYGNGDIVAYTYDKLDRVKTIRYNDINVLVTYTYDYMGNVALAKVTNSAQTVEYATYLYEYDSLGRLLRYYETLGDEIVQQVETSYDSKNRTASYSYYDGSQMRSIDYTYDDNNSGVLTRYDFGTDGALGYTYDALNRVNKKFIRHTSSTATDWEVAYQYKAGSAANQTTSLVSQLKYAIGSQYYTFNYTYDNLGNITNVTDGNGNPLGVYVYDKQNQLVFEEVYPVGEEPYSMVYTYDTFGNITKAEKYKEDDLNDPSIAYQYGTLLSTETYGYTDSSWKDLLTSFKGTTITYDTIGNPLSYYNGQSYTFTWEKGKQLASAVTGGKTLSFEYNADGIRTEKTVSGEYTYTYRLDGDKVVEMVKDGVGVHNRYVFIYDNDGNPHAMYYYYNNSTTPTKYYYVLNLQGDVVQLRNSSNTVIANYTYDAWGKLLSVTNASGTEITGSTHIANINPIRYRGYFYDTETKLYYCNSRYYDPQTRRFVNADDEAVLTADVSSMTQHNLFAYCLNNPVNMDDNGGQWPKWAKKAVAAVAVVAVVAAAAAIVTATGGAALAPLACTLTGAAQGAAVGLVSGAVSGAVTGAVSHRLTTGSWQGAGNAALNGAADGALSGAITGAITGGIKSPYCFIAGTAIVTAAGYVAIENITKGDVVFAWNETTDEIELKRVVETYVNETDELIHLYVNGEKITTTPSHPFYSPVKGWTDAVHLRAGDILVLVNGEYVVLEKVQHEILESPIAVYNFQVEDDHTYYVGESGVLVHNACDVVKENGVRIKSFYPDDHGNPAHLHVFGGGQPTKIGPQGLPLRGYPSLSPQQSKVVENNLPLIKKAIKAAQKVLRNKQ